MSSPKRAAKIVAKAIVAKNAARSAAKSAAKLRPVVARPPLKPTEAAGNGAAADAKNLAAALERGIVDGKLDVVSTQALQSMMAIACRVYAARTEAGEQFLPLAKNSISATDVMVTASGLLKATDLAVFELGMWQSWTGR